MNNELSEIQAVLLDTFKVFREFCAKHDIKYYAAYGTLLGAVRHKGFIPWDDDIDVFMLRDDYNKFLSLRQELKDSTAYCIADYHDKDYPYNFAKFYDTTKTFWEYSHFHYVIGPFIDVFPLDLWDDKSEEASKFFDYQHEVFWKYRKSISHQSWKEIISDLIHLNGFEGPVKIVKKLWYAPRRKSFFNKIEDIQRQMNHLSGDHYIDYSALKSHKYKKEWFETAIKLPFEDTDIMAPSGYDGCLTVDYGDYMTPPEVHNRSGHYAYYINLERRLTIPEILKEKSKEVTARTPMSLSVLIDEIKHSKGF